MTGSHGAIDGAGEERGDMEGTEGRVSSHDRKDALMTWISIPSYPIDTC